MKKLFTIIFLLVSISITAQTYYTDSLVYRIDTTIIAGNDTITSDSNFVRWNYSFINPDSIYEDQFVILDSLGKALVPIQALTDAGFSSSGTVLRKKLTLTEMGWTPEQLRDSLIYPILQSIYGNVTKL